MGYYTIPHGYKLTLHCSPINVADSPYTFDDCKNPLLIAGDLSTDFGKEVSDWQGKTQTGNTCAAKSISLLIQDFLIQNGLSLEMRKKLFLNANLLGLIAYYNAYKKDPQLSLSKMHCGFVIKSAESLNVTLEKELSVLTQSENVFFAVPPPPIEKQ